MKIFSALTLSLVITLVVSACGTEATPTASPIDLQGTMVAAAATVVAETMAAIPTATPVPPTATSTDTPVPTNTLPPLPPANGTLTPLPNGNTGGGDPCIYKTLPATLKGEPIQVRIDNSTKAVVSVSVYLQQASPQGVCGYRGYTLDAGEFIVLNDLVEGCYTLWAWNPDPDEYFMVTNGTSCIDDSKPWSFNISTTSLKPGP